MHRQGFISTSTKTSWQHRNKGAVTAVGTEVFSFSLEIPALTKFYLLILKKVIRFLRGLFLTFKNSEEDWHIHLVSKQTKKKERKFNNIVSKFSVCTIWLNLSRILRDSVHKTLQNVRLRNTEVLYIFINKHVWEESIISRLKVILFLFWILKLSIQYF